MLWQRSWQVDYLSFKACCDYQTSLDNVNGDGFENFIVLLFRNLRDLHRDDGRRHNDPLSY